MESPGRQGGGHSRGVRRRDNDRLPLEGGSNTEILVNDEVFDPTANPTLAEWRSITPGYFKAAGIALLQGRTLDETDRGEENLGVVVNQALAELAWPDENPIGKLVRNSDSETQMDGPCGRGGRKRPSMGTRHPAEARNVHHARQLHGVDPRFWWSVPTATPSTWPRSSAGNWPAWIPICPWAASGPSKWYGSGHAGPSGSGQLIDFFMITGLILAAVGIYGTLSFTVAQRTREFGLRVALGAMRGDILKLVLRQGTLWILIGIVAGVVGAFLSSRALGSMVYGVESIDPLSMIAATTAVAVATLLASLLPARRASGVDPQIALRMD